MSLKTKKNSYHHGELKDALMEAALRILKQKGLTALSLREVARSAGVSHTAPYRHFADKGELLAALAEQGFRDLDRELRKCHARFSDPDEQFLQSGYAYIRVAIQNPNRTELMFGSLFEDSKKYSTLSQISASSFRALVETIEYCQKKGRMRRGDPQSMALSAWSLVHGASQLICSGKFSPKPAELEPFCLQLCRNLLCGLR